MTIEIESSQELEEHINESSELVVVYFYGEWSSSSNMIAPLYNKIAKEDDDISFLMVDTDEQTEIVEEYDVNAVPTFLYFKDGERVGMTKGADVRVLRKAIKKYR